MNSPATTSPHPGGVAIFEDRLILQARPPIKPEEREAIEQRCAGPIPAGLDRLWNVSFGGQVDYGLSVDFDGIIHEFSFTEIFYPGSDHYHDLFGWIDHEEQSAEEAAAREGKIWQGKLDYLPFGGFEYLERLYVCVLPGPDYGAVFAYAQGLPPAWTLNLHHNSVARIAHDVQSLFRALDLPFDPTQTAEEFAQGLEMMEAIDAIRADDPDRADTLTAAVRAAVIDWRSAVADGTIVSKPRHRHLALTHASNQGDVALLNELMTAGCDLDEPFRGGGGALDHALAHGKLEAAQWLIERNANIRNAVTNGAAYAPVAMIVELLGRGAIPTAIAASAAARAGNMESAEVIADALAVSDQAAVRKLVDDLAHWAGRAEATAERINAGTLMSNKAASNYLGEGERMRALRNHCQSLIEPEPSQPADKPFWHRLIRR